MAANEGEELAKSGILRALRARKIPDFAFLFLFPQDVLCLGFLLLRLE